MLVQLVLFVLVLLLLLLLQRVMETAHQSPPTTPHSWPGWAFKRPYSAAGQKRRS